MAIVRRVVKKVGLRRAAAPEEASEVLTLPTERTKPCGALQDYSILIYGKKKIGKTTLTSMFQNAFHALCEPGGKALALFSRPVRNWLDLRTYIQLVVKSKFYKNAVIDTTDYSYNYALKYTCGKLVINHPSDEAWGKGWRAVIEEYEKVLNPLLHSGKGVIFISHSKEVEIKEEDGGTYNFTTSTLSGQAKELLEGVVDIWACYTYEKGKRILIIQGDETVDAGHRCEGRFLYTDGTPIKRIPMGNSKEEAYTNFVAAFENRLARPSGEGAVKKKIILKRS